MDKNINKKYGKLKIVKLDHIDKYYYKHYLCECECGNKKIINFNNLKQGKTKSCGCLYKTSSASFKKKYNKYIKRKDYVIGYTTNTNKKFYIDKEDYEKIKNISWFENKSGYILHKNKKILFLHRFIMNAPNDKVVDHINHKPYDNRKKNLRLVTQKENSLNRKTKPKGITKNIVDGKTYYMVQLKGYRGNYSTYKEAKKIRDEIIKTEYEIK